MKFELPMVHGVCLCAQSGEDAGLPSLSRVCIGCQQEQVDRIIGTTNATVSILCDFQKSAVKKIAGCDCQKGD
jgi:hypothetical protein